MTVSPSLLLTMPIVSKLLSVRIENSNERMRSSGCRPLFLLKRSPTGKPSCAIRRSSSLYRHIQRTIRWRAHLKSIAVGTVYLLSTYYRHKQLEREPDKRCARVKRDEGLEIKITEVWEDSFRNYGILKIWHQLSNSGETVARCTVQRLMKHMGIECVRRGKKCKTTISMAKLFARWIW